MSLDAIPILAKHLVFLGLDQQEDYKLITWKNFSLHRRHLVVGSSQNLCHYFAIRTHHVRMVLRTHLLPGWHGEEKTNKGLELRERTELCVRWRCQKQKFFHMVSCSTITVELLFLVKNHFSNTTPYSFGRRDAFVCFRKCCWCLLSCGRNTSKQKSNKENQKRRRRKQSER